ncbi:MAG TPA: hypothetical protein VNH18_27425 [Bryobacteraceae bacterium]|nr:hypothetical protein [Bryobacteraceae bacterium]
MAWTKQEFFERGMVILSFDTEQIWGYSDHFSEAEFLARFPGAFEAHDRLLDRLCAADIRATWFLVGGLALPGSQGARDGRMAGLPAEWTSTVPAGSERTAPEWYRRSFVKRLREALPRQEIGLHGGLIHLIWSDRCVTRDVARRELAEGLRALNELGVSPSSFSYPREKERYHELLPLHGISCYRGRTPTFAMRLGRTLPGGFVRILDERRRATPPPVWPREVMPGLWNIPASLFLYPIGISRSRLVPLQSRVERFRRGIDAAVRHRGIFHYCLHTDNLAEAPGGFSMLDDILELLVRRRESGDIEISTLAEVTSRMHAEPIAARPANPQLSVSER